MERERHGRTRAAGAFAHLLLVVVLALGVFMMHSTGHPQGSGPSGEDAVVSDASAPNHHVGASDGSASHRSAAHEAASYGAAAEGPASHQSSPHQSSPHRSSSHGSDGTGMDMTTLCVAVLGVWLIAALVRAAALGRRSARVDELLARLLPALGPNAPPPRPPDLAQLSVLRI
ncbi:hypothetical protein ACFY7C_03445 [Streptomyces sp. NPDC012769]|uniref:hypothetical protein n=1 Tax=Streptomyces sp. NPDC012769 TaxID=3364848 RepID=UPI0036D0B213